MIRALMSSQKAKYLFRRGILQSDPQNYPFESRAISRDVIGADALSILGCSDVTCARGKSISDIVAATTQVNANGMYLNAMVPVTPLCPTIDGTWIQDDFSNLIASNSLPNPVDVIMGIISIIYLIF